MCLVNTVDVCGSFGNTGFVVGNIIFFQVMSKSKYVTLYTKFSYFLHLTVNICYSCLIDYIFFCLYEDKQVVLNKYAFILFIQYGFKFSSWSATTVHGLSVASRSADSKHVGL